VIARTLGVDEKTVRYRLARLREPRPDRRRKAFVAEALAEVIGAWVERHEGRGLKVAALYDHLVVEHDYRGSYKSVQRYVRAHYTSALAARSTCHISTSPKSMNAASPQAVSCSQLPLATHSLEVRANRQSLGRFDRGSSFCQSLRGQARNARYRADPLPITPVVTSRQNCS
jgi:hypothetical protein